jgi:hypothetical protein
MSGAGARLPVVPTVTVLGMVKIRLVAAKKGHQLLKKKARGAAQQRSGNTRKAPFDWWPSLACCRRALALARAPADAPLGTRHRRMRWRCGTARF